MTEKQPTSILKNAICEFKKLNLKIHKETKNTFYKSNYADLATILDVIEAEAANLGLFVTSKTEFIDGALYLKTKLSHKDSDEVEETIFPIMGSKPQEIGSSMTYARRYNIQALLNLAADDDDGNAANEATPIKKQLFPTAKARTECFNAVVDKLNATQDLSELVTVWSDCKDDIAKLRQSDEQIYLELEKRKNELKSAFTEIENAGQ